jgi:hypothetical protein
MTAKRRGKVSAKERIEIGLKEVENAVKDVRVGLRELEQLLKRGDCDGFETPWKGKRS